MNNRQCLLPVQVATRALLYGRGFAMFEDLRVVVHVGDELLRFLAEIVEVFRLLEVLKEGFLVRLVLELLNQLLDFVFAICILFFNYRTKYTKNSVIHGVVPCLTGTL